MTGARIVTASPQVPSPRPSRPGDEDVVSFGSMAGLARRRWLLVALSVLCCVSIAVGYLMITPASYESGASLLVEDKEYDVPDVMKRINNLSDVNTQLEVLRSAGLAEQVVKELGLRVNATAYSGPGATWADSKIGQILPSIPTPTARSQLLAAVVVDSAMADTTTVTLTRIATGDFRALDSRTGKKLEPVKVGKPATLGGVTFTLAAGAAEFSKIDLGVGTLRGAVNNLRETIRINRADRDVDVIWIRYRATDPVLAARVPDLWAAHYLESRVANAKSKIQTAVGFLRGQADTLQGQLTQAETALRDYRQRQGIVDLPSEAMSSVSQRAEVGTKQMLLESERTALRSLVADADKDKGTGGSAYRRLAGFPGLIDNPVVSGHLHTLSDLEDQRSQLLERRTPQDPDVVAIDRRIGDVDAALRGLTNTYLEGLNNQLSSLDKSMATQGARAARIPSQTMDEERLSRKPKLLSDVYAMVQTRLQEARIAENAADPGVRMIDHADLPTIPVWPRKSLILLVAGVVGLMIGGAFAWLREGLDGSVHSRADVIRASGVPLLGLIPRIQMLRKNRMRPMPELITGMPQGFGSRARRRRTEQSHKALLMGGTDKSGAALEAYAWLETSLSLTRPNDAPRTVAFTSPLSREGKTINASNLALSVARKGKRVLLIDADLRRGMIHHLFGVAQDRGLADVLSGRLKVEQAIRVLPLGQGCEIHVMPSGETEGHPSNAMRPEALRELLTRLREHYDLILIDSPPVNLVSDPLVVAAMVDGVILVARAGVTHAEALAQASQHLREAGAPVLGVLLNDIDTKRDSSYDDAYRYLDEAGAYGSVVPA